MNRVNISFVIDSLEVGGAGILTLNVIRRLEVSKYKIRLISLTPFEYLNKGLADFIPPYVKISFLKRDNLSIFGRMRILRETLKESEIVHSCLEYSNLYCSILNLFSLKRRVFIATVHGLDWIFIDDKNLKNLTLSKRMKNVLIFYYLQNFLFKFYDRFIAVSCNTKEFLISKRKVPPNKIDVVYHGIDLKYSVHKNLVDKTLSGHSDFTMGYVGRLVHGKGLVFLLNAFLELSGNIDNLKLLFIGDGSLRDPLMTMIDENHISEKCKITGFVDNVLDYYRSFDLFVLPSLSEGIPLTLLEAMSLGKIALCSEVGGIPEVIKNNYNGFLFRKENMKDFVSKFMFIFSNFNQFSSIRQNAVNTIISHFDINKNIYKISNIIENLVRTYK